ncbi:MAG: hypothetical protein Q8R28_18995 [Dehalococcoidia bacterium]|nr:hypothetical protein [Dehalococcoidia bacterium]
MPNGIDQLLAPGIQLERTVAQALRQPAAAAGVALPALPPGPFTATRDLASGRFPTVPGLQVPAGIPRPPALPQFTLPFNLPTLPGIAGNGGNGGNGTPPPPASPFTRARLGPESLNGNKPITPGGFATSM